MKDKYDVVVIGGGAAGLSAGLTLSRARRSVLVVDDGHPRNAPADHMHNYLGLDGTPPQDLLARGRDEVRRYGGEVVAATVTDARREDDLVVVLAKGEIVHADRLLITTGVTDQLPDVPGLAERFGRDVLHCPYCHGWEVRDQVIAILGTGPMAVHQALLWRQWSPHVTLYQHIAPDPTDDELKRLAERGITVVRGKVTGVEVADDKLRAVRVDDQVSHPADAVVVASTTTARAAFLSGLGVELAEQVVHGQLFGYRIETDPMGRTNVPGVWAAGNVTDLGAQVIVAAAAGTLAAAAINADLAGL